MRIEACFKYGGCRHSHTEYRLRDSPSSCKHVTLEFGGPNGVHYNEWKQNSFEKKTLSFNTDQHITGMFASYRRILMAKLSEPLTVSIAAVALFFLTSKQPQSSREVFPNIR